MNYYHIFRGFLRDEIILLKTLYHYRVCHGRQNYLSNFDIPPKRSLNLNLMRLYFTLSFFFILLSKCAINSIEDRNSTAFIMYLKWETQKNIMVKTAMVTREDRAGNEFKENHPSFFSCPRSSSRSRHRVFFSRCAESNYFSGPHSHGRL